MYYAETIIDGILYCRTDPDEEWRIVTSDLADALNAMMKLTDDQRTEVISRFCTHCGKYDGNGFCQCWNDE